MWPNRRMPMLLRASYDAGAPASVKKIPGEYLSKGCDSLSDLRSMIELVAAGV